MKHLFVPYELALKLKDKGFDEPCILYFSSGMLQLNQPATMFGWKIKELIELDSYDKQTNKRLLAPLYQQVVDWFREKHSLSIEVNTEFTFGKFMWQIIELKPKPLNVVKSQKVVGLYSYYEAFNEGIEEALKLI